jgi:hypothetical protein
MEWPVSDSRPNLGKSEASGNFKKIIVLVSCGVELAVRGFYG